MIRVRRTVQHRLLVLLAQFRLAKQERAQVVGSCTSRLVEDGVSPDKMFRLLLSGKRSPGPARGDGKSPSEGFYFGQTSRRCIAGQLEAQVGLPEPSTSRGGCRRTRFLTSGFVWP